MLFLYSFSVRSAICLYFRPGAEFFKLFLNRRMAGVCCVQLALLLLLLGIRCNKVECKATLSLEKTLVFGPGVNPKQGQLPLTVIYIQARDKNGKNFTDVTPDTFEVVHSAPSGRVFRMLEKYSLGGGLIVYVCRFYSDHLAVDLSITHNGKHVAQSPYRLRNVFSDYCNCPFRNPQQWLSDYECPATDPQIVSDLKPFESGINVTELSQRGAKEYDGWSFIHYSIIGNKLYRRKFGTITDFKSLSDMILLSVLQKVRLPDMELMVNLGDWPMNTKSRTPYPIFSWCGSDGTRDIVWPNWELMRSTVTGMDRVSLTILWTQQGRAIPWEERQPKVFFRGRDSNQARLDLVQRHHKDTNNYDVGLTNYFFFPHKEELYGPIANYVGMSNFFKYKYQINIDGTVAAYRLPFLLAGGSLVFKQDSEYYEHFYHKLSPGQNYVPVQKSLNDLPEKLKWAKENDKQAKKIAQNGAQFVQDHLLPQPIFCYIVSLLTEYAKLQIGTPTLYPDMEEANPERSNSCNHVCEGVQHDEL